MVIIKPAASEMLGFFRGKPCPLSAFSGVDASISDWKSDMLFGRADISSCQYCSLTGRSGGSENCEVECTEREARECILGGRESMRDVYKTENGLG